METCLVHRRMSTPTGEGSLPFGAVSGEIECSRCNELHVILGIQADTQWSLLSSFHFLSLPFLHSFNVCLLSSYCVPGTIFGLKLYQSVRQVGFLPCQGHTCRSPGFGWEYDPCGLQNPTEFLFLSRVRAELCCPCLALSLRPTLSSTVPTSHV